MAALLAVSLAVLAVGAAPSAPGAAGCSQTDVVFYTNAVARLVGELTKFPSPCTDYYVSVPPLAGGIPNGGPPLAAVRAAGANFHAMAEIRLTPWSDWVSAEPGRSWYGAGLRVRELMHDAGYDPAKDDTWALNELGEPATHAMGIAVIKNVGDARKNVRDFMRGLYTGDGTPMRGLVFAANPLHVATDLAEYKHDLDNWYADSEFWEDIGQYVRFWAQETYADVRRWGVPGSTLTDRTAYLNDYFMHGLRLAAARGAATEAARAFFESTYTPVGNATYRNPPREPGIGFGSTDVDLTTMLNFVSTQTYALRSSTGERFGFADQRIPSTLPLAQVIAVEDRVAEAIQASETDPSGACGASGEWCGGAVAGAVFTDLWRDVTPPTVECMPSPSRLWPPNGQLVPVTVAVTVADALSGPGTFALTDTSTGIGGVAADIVGFDVGTPDTAGLLRARRPGALGERVYTLTYTALDVAGNAGRCDAIVVVPHDQRK